MPESSPAQRTKPDAMEAFFPIDIESLVVPLSEFDIHLRHDSSGNITLYSARDAEISDEDRLRLLDTGVKRVFAPVEQHAVYRRLLLERIEAALNASDQPIEDRVAQVRRAACAVLEEALRSPGKKEPVLTALDLGRLLHKWLFEKPALYGQLPDLSARRYALPGHMLNVALLGGLLCMVVRQNDRQLALDVIHGGLLHDIGKRAFDEETLLKQGALTPPEWGRVMRHPQRGHDELAAHGAMTEDALSLVHDHHERLDGEGFPRGVGGDDLGPEARIGAIADTLDTLMCARPTRKGIHPLDALELMAEGVGSHFDPEALTTMGSVVSALTRAQPSRVGCPRLPDLHDALPSVTKILQSSPSGMAAYIPPARSASSSIWGRERRRGKRTEFKSVVHATLVRQGKSTQAPNGTEIELRTLDISGGGMQVCTPWAFSKGDLLLLRLTTAQGKTILQHAHVVRVRERSDGMWSAGVEFLSHSMGRERAERETPGDGAIAPEAPAPAESAEAPVAAPAAESTGEAGDGAAQRAA